MRISHGWLFGQIGASGTGNQPPEILQLDRIVDRPPGQVPHAVTEVEVRYSEDTNAAYTEVNILPDDLTISVKQLEQPN